MFEQRKIAIAFNGPPRAGKDTATLVALDIFDDIAVYQFTRPVKELTHKEWGLDVAFDHYETLKDTPLPEFGGMSPRQAYIAKSDALKREKGPDVVADLFVEAIVGCNSGIMVNPDCGGDMEAHKIAGVYGYENLLVVRIHKDGHDFSQDCRTWVTDPLFQTHDIKNVQGERREFQSEIAAVIKSFVDGFKEKIDYAA